MMGVPPRLAGYQTRTVSCRSARAGAFAPSKGSSCPDCTRRRVVTPAPLGPSAASSGASIPGRAGASCANADCVPTISSVSHSSRRGRTRIIGAVSLNFTGRSMSCIGGACNSKDPKAMRLLRKGCSVLLPTLLLLASCGGGGSGGMPSGSSAATPQRGQLLQSPPRLLSTVTTSALLAELNAAAANQQVLALSGPPVCDFLMYHIEYETVGGAGEPTTASAALMIPTGAGSSCTGSRPVVEYAHGTTTERNFNMADMQNAETLLLAALFATQGYIVVAPNYAGYDTSTLPYHPFLIADQQSDDMIDALTAARAALPLASLTLTQDNGHLFITGYSQGGYVAMATLSAMQTAGMHVDAAVPMSGPYAVAAFADAVFYGEVNGGATVSTTLLATA